MQVLRPATLALLSVLAASGCRTAGVSDLARPSAPLAPARSLDATEILAEHNRNAELIQLIEARPALTVTVADPERPNRPAQYPVDGRLWMERPRNFKLELTSTAASKVADIGSNDAEYWFWVKDKTERSIYYCNYDETGASPLAATMQPDWIVEAMGLRIIPASEANEITVKPGEPGTLVLTHRPHKAGSQTYTRITILDKATYQILEHQIRSGDQKTLMARAKIPEGYIRVTGPSQTGSGEVTAFLPKKLQLHWVQERLDLEVTFLNVKINKPITQAQRDARFIEPVLGRDYVRKNLAENSGTTIRETRPAPPSGGVRLKPPTPIEGETTSTPGDDRKISPIALSGMGPTVPSLTEEIVGARFPAAAAPESSRAESPAWRAATGSLIDR